MCGICSKCAIIEYSEWWRMLGIHSALLTSTYCILDEVYLFVLTLLWSMIDEQRCQTIIQIIGEFLYLIIIQTHTHDCVQRLSRLSLFFCSEKSSSPENLYPQFLTSLSILKLRKMILGVCFCKLLIPLILRRSFPSENIDYTSFA